jgi:hypothetical protein
MAKRHLHGEVGGARSQPGAPGFSCLKERIMVFPGTGLTQELSTGSGTKAKVLTIYLCDVFVPQDKTQLQEGVQGDLWAI